MAALGRELISRGHRVTCFGLPDLEARVLGEGLEFQSVGAQAFPPGSLRRWLDTLGRLQGIAALRFTIDAVRRTTEATCLDGPDALRRSGVDALLVDQMEPAGGTLADFIGLPFVTICNALALNRDPMVPPPFTPWGPSTHVWARARNRLGYSVSDWITRPISRVVARYRRQWGLPAHPSPEASFSSLAQICQMPEAFDFPRRRLPERFSYVGPLRGRPPSPVPFPWDRLDGRPLVYASLGTLQNSREPVFRCFAEACQGEGVQLVISHGGGLTDAEAAALPGDPVVVGYAPQLEVLARASLTLTHAGLNTVLDSLACGVPLVAMPITYEQPAISRRVERTGAGRSLRFDRLRAGSLRTLIREVRRDATCQEAADRMREAIQRAGGVSRAADIVEHAARR